MGIHLGNQHLHFEAVFLPFHLPVIQNQFVYFSCHCIEMDEKAVDFLCLIDFLRADLQFAFRKSVHGMGQGKDRMDDMTVHQHNHYKYQNHIDTGYHKNTDPHRFEIRKKRADRNDCQLDPIRLVGFRIGYKAIRSLYFPGEKSGFLRKYHAWYMKVLIQSAVIRGIQHHAGRVKDIGDGTVHFNGAEGIVKNRFINRHKHDSNILLILCIQSAGNHILVGPERIGGVYASGKPDHSSFFAGNLGSAFIYIINDRGIG